MSRRPKVFYLGMITTDAYGRAVGELTYSGAATRKMLLIAAALRSVGHRALVVSLPFVGTKAARAGYGGLLQTEQGVPVVFLPTLRSKYLRKILAPLFLACFAVRRVHRRDTVIFYNHAIEYLLALFVLRTKGVRIIQDIEDAPTTDERGLRGLLNRVSFTVTSQLTAQRKMVVADHVARGLGLDDYIVVRGVASHETHPNRNSDGQKWHDLRMGKALRIHFGGTLIAETGVDLFCAALKLLSQKEHPLKRSVAFVVTGVGRIDQIRDLKSRLQGTTKIDLEIHPELGKADYLALIDSCHASLSLKRPDSEMANTTFPSKVIEITASGVALVSTNLGDVVEIFDGRSAFLLKSYEAADLVDVIVEMAGNPGLVERVARTGQAVCLANFSPEIVGSEMARLLKET